MIEGNPALITRVGRCDKIRLELGEKMIEDWTLQEIHDGWTDMIYSKYLHPARKWCEFSDLYDEQREQLIEHYGYLTIPRSIRKNSTIHQVMMNGELRWVKAAGVKIS